MKSDIEYNIVTHVEVEEVVKLYQAGGWWEENPHSREIIPGMVRGSFCFMLATHKGVPVGMGRVISDGYSDGYIQDLVVLPEYRGHGIGRELVRRLSRFCQDKGLDWVGLIAEPNTVQFYEKLGFHPMKDNQPMLFHSD